MYSQVQRRFASILSIAAIWNLGAVTCSAHPDHPVKIVADDSSLHYLLQPEHALPFVLLAVAAYWISRSYSVKLAARKAA